ncbi:hypothetical protein F4703DRAFT_1930630 [Phycomyces blakesleeanus]
MDLKYSPLKTTTNEPAFILDKIQGDLSRCDKFDSALESPYDVPASLKEIGVFSDMLYPQDAIRIREMKKDKEGSLAGDFAKNLPGMFSDPLPNVFLLRTLEFVLTMFEEVI